MKKFLLISLIILCNLSAKSFHYLGSEITCKQMDGLTYHLTAKFYGDYYSGWGWSNEIYLNVNKITPGINFNVIAILTDTKKLHNGVYELNYSAVLTFPTTGEYIITHSGCCRVEVMNAISASAQTYYNYCFINVDTITGNSSPEFLFDPIVLAPVNDTLYYNPLAYDSDGDLLLWSIDTPRMYYNEACIGYTTPAGSAGGNFIMNPKTGEITWIPVALGFYLTTIKLEEYRNGIKTGEVKRDIVIIVESKQGNNARAIVDTQNWTVDPSNNFLFNLSYNQPFNLHIIANDANNNYLVMNAKGAPFLLDNNPATFTAVAGAGYTFGDFSWTPSYEDIRLDPYIVAFRIYEEGIVNLVLRDRTIQLWVGNFTTTVEEADTYSLGNIYPVPSSGSLYFPITVKKDSDLKISFINQLGQEVKSLDKKLNTGQNLLYFSDLNLPAGIYFINTIIDGEAQVRKLVIE